jgi:hypothetical protein
VSIIVLNPHCASQRLTPYYWCAQWAVDVFERLYSKEVSELLTEHPADELDEDGQPFWGRYKWLRRSCVTLRVNWDLRFALCRSRKLPRAQSYNADDALHRAFVDALFQLRAVALGRNKAGARESTCGPPIRVEGEDGRARILRALTANFDFWESAALNPQEFDKVQCMGNDNFTMGCSCDTNGCLCVGRDRARPRRRGGRTHEPALPCVRYQGNRHSTSAEGNYALSLGCSSSSPLTPVCCRSPGTSSPRWRRPPRWWRAW